METVNHRPFHRPWLRKLRPDRTPVGRELERTMRSHRLGVWMGMGIWNISGMMLEVRLLHGWKVESQDFMVGKWMQRHS